MKRLLLIPATALVLAGCGSASHHDHVVVRCPSTAPTPRATVPHTTRLTATPKPKVTHKPVTPKVKLTKKH